jgi:hypothetical protein
MRGGPAVPKTRPMTRHATITLALCALLCAGLTGPVAAPADDAAHVATAAQKKKAKTRAQKLAACLRKANRKRGATRRRARSRCQTLYGAKKKSAGGNGVAGIQPPPPPAAGPAPPPPPPPPAVDPVRDDAKFREALKSSYFHRQYEVPKPNHGAGFNYHDENYEFCQSAMGHFYEGIAYIYRNAGPWEVVEGNVNGDGTKGNGTIRFTQTVTNFPEENGKVQNIQIQWAGDQASIVHPEIGTNAFTRQAKPAPCTQ